MIDFLKQELGFRGCLVSDAIPMAGIGSHVKGDELAVRNVAAGSDVVLFCEPERDFPALKRAVETGVITGERLHDAVRRVLTMKARLGSLETRRPAPAVTAEELAGCPARRRGNVAWGTGCLRAEPRGVGLTRECVL